MDAVRGGGSERSDFNNGDFGVADGRIGVDIRIASTEFFPNAGVRSR
jgi:hypothetical protein